MENINLYTYYAFYFLVFIIAVILFFRLVKNNINYLGVPLLTNLSTKKEELEKVRDEFNKDCDAAVHDLQKIRESLKKLGGTLPQKMTSSNFSIKKRNLTIEGRIEPIPADKQYKIRFEATNIHNKKRQYGPIIISTKPGIYTLHKFKTLVFKVVIYKNTIKFQIVRYKSIP